MKKIRNILAQIICFSCLLPSCLTSAKVDKQVSKHYNNISLAKKNQTNNITITSNVPYSSEQISTTETKTSNLLPLIVYWQWDYSNTCSINPQIPTNNFASILQNNVNSVLNTKLSGQNLELTINKIPNKFQILDKAHLIFFGYAYGWDKVSIKAIDMEMVVSYRLLKDNIEIKKGGISIPGFDDKTSLGMFKNWKIATKDYLNKFDENIAAMSKLVVDKLVAVL